jgi:transposase InsO family protein
VAWKFQDYGKYSYKTVTNEFLTGDVDRILRLMRGSQYSNAYLILTRSQRVYGELFYGKPFSEWQQFENSLTGSGNLRLIFDNRDAQIFGLIDNQGGEATQFAPPPPQPPVPLTRAVLVLAFCLIIPGWALVRLFSLDDRLSDLTLAVALSFSLETILATFMLYAGIWSPKWGLAALAGVSVGLVAVRFILQPAPSRRAGYGIEERAVEVLPSARLPALASAGSSGHNGDVDVQSDAAYTGTGEFEPQFSLAGLEGVPPAAVHGAFSESPEIVDCIVQLSLEHPAWSYTRLTQTLKLNAISTTPSNVRDILTHHGLGRRSERLLRLEELASQGAIELTEEQVEQIEKANPCFRERHVESSRPGELLCQSTLYVERLSQGTKLYLHTVVDSYSSYAFGFLHTSKQPEAAIAVLHHYVLPFYQQHAIPVRTIVTDSGRQYSGKGEHPYGLYLAQHNIEHGQTELPKPQMNGFVERFYNTALEEFFRSPFRTASYDAVALRQAEFGAWLTHYNTERPHQGYRNMGLSPLEAVALYLENVGADA